MTKTKKKRAWLWYFIAGTILILSGLMAVYFFADPYPCSASGIGCSSAWEMLADSWTSYYLMGSLLAGVGCWYKGARL